MKLLRFATVIGFVLCTAPIVPSSAASVRVGEGKLELPTYVLGEEDPNPPFPLLTGHSIYPYTMQDDLTDRVETKSYRAIFLENEYLKATVLPEMGGRLYSLYDKLNKREVFYRNRVVKYGLVAVRGAWISGGVEFNFPDGHTAVTVSPVASTTRENPDGSGTVIVGDLDLVSGMHWEVALTLRPGEARLEQQVTLFNPTASTNLYWYWANAAVPATADMRFVYPMREAYPHARWPVHTYPVFQGVDFGWYKNVRHSTSLFGRQVHRDFFGAYYTDSDYGAVHWADYREVPGKKIWTWGVADDGLIWTDLLTDSDGPYNEIQSGRYETQLNYEFMRPRRLESWTEYWYPVRGLGGGFVEATRDLALNARFLPPAGGASPSFEIALSSAVGLESVKVRLESGSRTVREFGPVSLQPLVPAIFRVQAEDTQGVLLDSNVVVEILSAGGQTLARWSQMEPVDGNPDFVPAAGAPEPQPKNLEKMTVEEHFLSGEEQEKDGRALAARETIGRVLERDPGFIPALLKEAWWRYRSADFAGAEDLVGRALARDSSDPRAQYAAGVIYRASNRLTRAASAFWEAIHYGGPQAAAFAELGEIAIRQKEFDQAARLLRQSLSYNRDDSKALADLAVALRLEGNVGDAAKAVNAALQKMPLLPFALAEQRRVEQARQGKNFRASEARRPLLMKRDVRAYLDVAAWCLGLDDLPSASTVLDAARDEAASGAGTPLVDYYRAFIAKRSGQVERADYFLAQAAKAPVDYIFPSRLADAEVLAEAVERNPLDAHALYLLGNFLFACGRYDGAAKLWFQALGAGFDHPVLERNLGVYAWKVKKDSKTAAGYYEKALQLAPNDHRLYRDLDEIYFLVGDDSRRAQLFAKAPAAVLDRDTLRVRRALLYAQQRHFDEALALFERHDFRPWEGGEIIRQVYVLACVGAGQRHFDTRDFRAAEATFRKALEYPRNLGIGRPDKPRDAEALYWLGRALQEEGKTEEARAAWQKAAEDGKGLEGTSRLYGALALIRLGRAREAEKILSELLEEASGRNPSASALYVAGLADRAQCHEDAAREEFRRALELAPSLWQARIELERARP
ncbi:MAG: hypothetical protein DMG23_00900 [Acidobacteria bacterium]|nr:MAG: hypothetical protein DMG23_00900 [Acidobacteriota bacterium]